ncbi:MAG TPA: hypothetical protein PLK94_14645, partial [Alphaproteobacteria bacterium]|nr:hypothetical protein [Alphaproteobacteria bacterium]
MFNGSPRALQSLAMTGRGLKTFFSREVSKKKHNPFHLQPRFSAFSVISPWTLCEEKLFRMTKYFRDWL